MTLSQPKGRATPAPGRPRDTDIDAAIVAATLELLSEVGFEATTFAAIADRAGTSRPAVYRRFGTKAEAATAALGLLSRTTAPERTGNHYGDLVAELTAFRNGTTRAGGTSLVATMLADGTDQAVKATYREIVVQPRRTRLTTILAAAAGDGLLDASRDEIELAVSMCTGSWHHLMLADKNPPRSWPARIAALAWRALGGTPPAAERF